MHVAIMMVTCYLMIALLALS